MSNADNKCRLDKWLLAARFYKTRGLAIDAIEGGKVRVDAERAKPAKEVKIGMLINIRNKEFELECAVTGLSSVRRGAPEAALLYAETAASIAKRENAKLTKINDTGVRERGMGRPTKRQQRDIKKFTGIF